MTKSSATPQASVKYFQNVIFIAQYMYQCYALDMSVGYRHIMKCRNCRCTRKINNCPSKDVFIHGSLLIV